MSRKKAREIALHLIFEMGFGVFEAENVMTDGLGEDVLHALGEEIELYAGPLNASQTQYIVSAVKGVASHLEELDAQILTLRFGLEGGLPLTPEQTGARLGLTGSQVTARETAALGRLRGEGS